ncbi:hypothetical protein [Streptomyces violascens]
MLREPVEHAALAMAPQMHQGRVVADEAREIRRDQRVVIDFAG